MNTTSHRQTAHRFPSIIAFVIALGALALTAMAALFAVHPGIPTSSPPLGNLISVTHTYLFRNAVTNSLIVVTPLTVLVYILARFAYGPRTKTMQAWNARIDTLYVLAVAATPLFLPVPTSAFVWSPLYDRLDLLSHPQLSLAVILVVQTWRLWPLALVSARLAHTTNVHRSALGAALLAGAIALVDAATPLTISGGEPYNETHLWATWSAQAAWVSHLWGHAAVMYGGLALGAGAMAACAWLMFTNPRDAGALADSATGIRVRSWAILAGVGSALLPLVWLLPSVSIHAPQRPSGTVLWMWACWASGSFLLVLAAALIAAGVALPSLRAEMRRRGPFVPTAVAAGFAAIPAWDWILQRAQLTAGPWVGWGLIILAVSSSAGLIALWPLRTSAIMHADSKWRIVGLPLLTTASIFAANQFFGPLVAAESMQAWTLTSGISLRIGTGSTGEAISVVALLTFVTTLALAITVSYMFAARQR